MVNYQHLLSELLAVIHSDGGHYEAEHGTVKAVTDAIEKIFEMKSRLTMRAADPPSALEGDGESKESAGG